MQNALNGKSIKVAELDHSFAILISKLKKDLEAFKEKYKIKAPPLQHAKK